MTGQTGRRPIYERPAGGWGRVNLGRIQVSGRAAVIVVGALMWLLTVVVRTGSHGLTAFATNLLMVAFLVVVGSGTRSTTVRRTASMFFFGGASFLGVLLLAVVLDPTGPSSDVHVSLSEELLKLAPLLVFLWARRNDRTWSLGATDVLLLAAACGAGFAVLEDAHIRTRGWAGTLPLLPSSEVRIGGGVIVGHALWSALAGAGIGIALLFRNRMAVALPVAGAGFLVAVLDHIGLNSGSRLLGVLTADGYLTLILLLGGLATCIALDLRVLRGLEPRPPELSPPRGTRDLAGLLATWAFLLEKRALLYAAYQHVQAPEESRGRPRAVAVALASSVYARHHGPPSMSDL